jgi:hypothetical protein
MLLLGVGYDRIYVMVMQLRFRGFRNSRFVGFGVYHTLSDRQALKSRVNLVKNWCSQ